MLWQNPLLVSNRRVSVPYPYAFPGGQVLGASGTDGIFACSARNADALLSNFTNTYVYEFNDENAPPQPSPGLISRWVRTTAPRFSTYSTLGFFLELTPAAAATIGKRWSATGRISRLPAIPTAALCRPGRPTVRVIDQFQSLIPPTPTVESTFNSDHICDAFWNLIP